MAHKYVLDAHALIWYLEGNPKLGNAARSILDDTTAELVLPVIVLAEAETVVRKKPTKIPDFNHVLNRIDGDPRFEIFPLTDDIFRRSLTALAVPEIHDRLIVATVLQLNNFGASAALLTKDPEIIKSNLVTVIW